MGGEREETSGKVWVRLWREDYVEGGLRNLTSLECKPQPKTQGVIPQPPLVLSSYPLPSTPPSCPPPPFARSVFHMPSSPLSSCSLAPPCHLCQLRLVVAFPLQASEDQKEKTDDW